MNRNGRFGRADIIALKWKLLFALPVLVVLMQTPFILGNHPCFQEFLGMTLLLIIILPLVAVALIQRFPNSINIHIFSPESFFLMPQWCNTNEQVKHRSVLQNIHYKHPKEMCFVTMCFKIQILFKQYINTCVYKYKSACSKINFLPRAFQKLNRARGDAKSDIPDTDLSHPIIRPTTYKNLVLISRLLASLKMIQIFQQHIEELLHSHESLDAHGVNELFSTL